ncbi:putative holin-like toxin [Alicyclobacillus acidocaldarius]
MTVADALSLLIQFGSFVMTCLSLVVALVLALTRKRPPP